jgi:hypothetical protein
LRGLSSRVVDRSVSAARLCPGLYREGIPNDPEDAPMKHTELVSVVAALLMSAGSNFESDAAMSGAVESAFKIVDKVAKHPKNPERPVVGG